MNRYKQLSLFLLFSVPVFAADTTNNPPAITSRIETEVVTNWTSLSNVMCSVQLGRVITNTVHVLKFKGKEQRLVLEETNGPAIGIKYEPVPLGPGRAYTVETPPPLPTMPVRIKE